MSKNQYIINKSLHITVYTRVFLFFFILIKYFFLVYSVNFLTKNRV